MTVVNFLDFLLEWEQTIVIIAGTSAHCLRYGSRSDPVHLFKCFKNPVGAWIDRDGRAIAPENLPLLVDDE
jgi:hypothetical protein